MIDPARRSAAGAMRSGLPVFKAWAETRVSGSSATPDSACMEGAACNYPSGVSCDCVHSRWMCIGTSACPADVPSTGATCNGLAGVLCDYPNQNPHMSCLCSPLSDASMWTWGCFPLSECPATQPAYDLSTTCTGLAMCSYGSTRCGCRTGFPWVCGLGVGFYSWLPIEGGGGYL